MLDFPGAKVALREALDAGIIPPFVEVFIRSDLLALSWLHGARAAHVTR